MRAPLPLIRPPSTPASLASPRLILTTPHPHHLKVLWHKVPPYAVNYHTTTPSPMVGWTVGQRLLLLQGVLLLQEEKSSASSSTPPRSWPHQVAMPCPYQMQPLAQPRRHRHRHRGQATPHYRRRPSVGTQYLIVLTTRRDEDDVRKDSASTLRLSHPDPNSVPHQRLGIDSKTSLIAASLSIAHSLASREPNPRRVLPTLARTRGTRQPHDRLVQIPHHRSHKIPFAIGHVRGSPRQIPRCSRDLPVS